MLTQHSEVSTWFLSIQIGFVWNEPGPAWYTVLVLINLTKVALRLRCGCVAVPIFWFFDIISSFFAKFKNVVHNLEPGETPRGVSPGSKLCATLLNIAKYFKTLRLWLRCGCVYFFNLLKTSSVHHTCMYISQVTFVGSTARSIRWSFLPLPAPSSECPKSSSALLSSL